MGGKNKQGAAGRPPAEGASDWEDRCTCGKEGGNCEACNEWAYKQYEELKNCIKLFKEYPAFQTRGLGMLKVLRDKKKEHENDKITTWQFSDAVGIAVEGFSALTTQFLREQKKKAEEQVEEFRAKLKAGTFSAFDRPAAVCKVKLLKKEIVEYEEKIRAREEGSPEEESGGLDSDPVDEKAKEDEMDIQEKLIRLGLVPPPQQAPEPKKDNSEANRRKKEKERNRNQRRQEAQELNKQLDALKAEELAQAAKEAKREKEAKQKGARRKHVQNVQRLVAQAPAEDSV